MDDIEQQCEDALFELCDARERYPLRCAEELQKSIKLQNDINMLKVFKKSSTIDKPTVLEQNECLDLNFSKDKCFDQFDLKLQNIINKLHNLKSVVDQVERERKYWINKLLEN